VKQKLVDIYGLMERVDILLKNPKANKPTLMKYANELQAYEKQINGLQQKLGSPVQLWNEKLQSTGEDAQLANVDLQGMLQKQQQTLQMMSNISKMLHDTAMAIIGKIRV